MNYIYNRLRGQRWARRPGRCQGRRRRHQGWRRGRSSSLASGREEFGVEPRQ